MFLTYTCYKNFVDLEIKLLLSCSSSEIHMILRPLSPTDLTIDLVCILTPFCNSSKNYLFLYFAQRNGSGAFDDVEFDC